MWPAMIFVAGKGTRMRHLTKDRPKPMVLVSGQPLIEHALRLAVEAGVLRAVVNVHYKPEPLLAYLAGEERLEICVSDESGGLLDTGGGLRKALPLLSANPVLTLNADAAWAGPNPISYLATAGPPPKGGARLLLVPQAQAAGHLGSGDFFCHDVDHSLRRRGGAATAPFVYTGLQVIDTELLHAATARAFSLNTIWDEMIETGRLSGVVYPGHWCDVGQPESIPLAEALLADV